MSLEDEMAKKYMEKVLPYDVAIELTSRCNMKCCHCYVVEFPRHDELSTEEIMNIIDQLEEEKIFTITFTGGEIFLREDLFDLISYAREKAFEVILYTNATLINSKAVRKIKENCVSSVEISIYGATASTHEKITRVKGSFEKTMSAVSLLKGSGIKVILKTVYMKQNFREYKAIRELCQSLGIVSRSDIDISYKNDGSPEPAKYRLSNSELYSFLKEVYEEEKGTGIWIGIEDKKCITGEGKVEVKEGDYRETCGAGIVQCAISPVGKVFPCIGMPLEVGDLRKETFHNIWWSSEKLLKIRNLPGGECNICNLANLCGKCMGHCFLEGRSLLACAPYAKEIAEIRNELLKNKGTG